MESQQNLNAAESFAFVADEKWIFYNNFKFRKTVCKKNETSAFKRRISSWIGVFDGIFEILFTGTCYQQSNS